MAGANVALVRDMIPGRFHILGLAPDSSLVSWQVTTLPCQQRVCEAALGGWCTLGFVSRHSADYAGWRGVPCGLVVLVWWLCLGCVFRAGVVGGFGGGVFG